MAAFLAGVGLFFSRANSWVVRPRPTPGITTGQNKAQFVPSQNPHNQHENTDEPGGTPPRAALQSRDHPVTPSRFYTITCDPINMLVINNLNLKSVPLCSILFHANNLSNPKSTIAPLDLPPQRSSAILPSPVK